MGIVKEVFNLKFYTMNNKEQIFTITFTCKPQCHHRNGWFKSVMFKWWIFNFKRKFFLCTDCKDLIPFEQADKVKIKDALKNGEKIEGCEIVENFNLQIK